MDANQDLIAIFAALEDEIRIFKSKMAIDSQIHIKPSLIIKGRYDNKSVLLIRSGIGKEAMRAAVDYCLQYFNPSVCLNVGYAGGTTPSMSVGDIIIASPVVNYMTKKSYESTNDLLDQAVKLCKNHDLKAMRGTLVTTDKLISTPHEKAFIGTEHDALAIDMESSAFMERCILLEKPCLVVRSILDPLDTTLPDMSDAIEKTGETSLGNVAKHLIHRPKDALSLPKIEYCTITARETITTFTDAWVKK